MKEIDNHNKKRLTLDSIEKKAVYEVNKNYFDELPTRIQNRVISHEKQSSPGYILSKSLKYALPVVAIVIMAIYFGNRFNASEIDVQALIDEVSTEELVAYLSESELTTDDIIALIDVEELDVDGMFNEDISLLDESEFDAVLDEFEDLETELQ